MGVVQRQRVTLDASFVLISSIPANRGAIAIPAGSAVDSRDVDAADHAVEEPGHLVDSRAGIRSRPSAGAWLSPATFVRPHTNVLLELADVR